MTSSWACFDSLVQLIKIDKFFVPIKSNEYSFVPLNIKIRTNLFAKIRKKYCVRIFLIV